MVLRQQTGGVELTVRWLEQTDRNNARGDTSSPTPSAVTESPSPTSALGLKKSAFQVAFAEPTAPAQLSEDDARAAAMQRYGPAPTDSPLAVEYKLISDATNTARPGYLVTYHNLPPTPVTGRFTPAESSRTDQRRLTVFIDANTGEYLYALSW